MSRLPVTGDPVAGRGPGGVTPEQWNDWRWQLRNRLNTAADFERIVELTDDERRALDMPGLFRIEVTPFLASLIDPTDPACPIRRQILPSLAETLPFPGQEVDSLGEEGHTVVPGLVHRYPDRVLMLLTTQCASYCRFCTRSRIVGDASESFSTTDFDRQIDYIARHPEVRDVLLSGGDPLVLAESRLENLLSRLRAIPHVEIIRLGTRVPLFLPQRITASLCEMLKRFHPLWVNVHLNHPNELVPEVGEALERLADAGIPLGSQTVLMAGVNDCPNVMKALVHRLVRHRVRPYYLYQCDLVRGAGHFRTPVAKGIEIIEALRGHTSGYAVPTFVVDMPGGGGKVPLGPDYVVSTSPERVVVRNYRGTTAAYSEPVHYAAHDEDDCRYCREARENSRVTARPDGSGGRGG